MKAEDKIIYVPEFMMALIAMDENKGGSMLDMHFNLKISYSFLHDMKKMFISKGWIVIKVDGKKHIPIITEKGKEVLKVIYDLLIVLGVSKEDVFAFRLARKSRDKNKIEDPDFLIAKEQFEKNLDKKMSEEETKEVIDSLGEPPLDKLWNNKEDVKWDKVDIELIDGDEKDGTKKESVQNDSTNN